MSDEGGFNMALFKRKISLPMQVIIALVLGVVVGLLLFGQDNVANYIKPFGDVFLNLIKMIIIPIVFCALALSISNLGDSKKIGSYGWKAILYFEIITTIAIGLGLIIGNLFKPGAGLDPDKLPKGDISKYQSSASAAEQSTYGNHFIDTIVNIVPTNIFEALTKGELLPIIFFAVFFGLGLAAIGEKADPVKGFLNGTLEAVFKISTNWCICIYLYNSNDFWSICFNSIIKISISSSVRDGVLYYRCSRNCSKNLWY